MVRATTTAAPTARPVTKLMPITSMPSSEMTTVVPAKVTARPGGVDGDLGRAGHVVPGVEVLPEPGDDEERVVDADPEADHHAERGGEVGHRHHVAEQAHEDRADADAGQGDADGQAHGQDRAEGEDQDDDGEGQAEQLGGGCLELGEGLAAEEDPEAVDLGHLGLDLLGDVLAVLDARVRGQVHVGVGHGAGRLAPRGDLRRALGGVRAAHGHAREVVGGGEEALHGRPHLRVVHPLLGREHDGPALARADAVEGLLQDVGAPPALDVRQGELGARGGADGAQHRAEQHDRADPEGDDQAPARVAPAAEASEHGGPPAARRVGGERASLPSKIPTRPGAQPRGAPGETDVTGRAGAPLFVELATSEVANATKSGAQPGRWQTASTLLPSGSRTKAPK